MAKNSFVERIKITKTGKLMRRKVAQGHFRARKSSRVIQGKRNPKFVSLADEKFIKRFLD